MFPLPRGLISLNPPKETQQHSPSAQSTPTVNMPEQGSQKSVESQSTSRHCSSQELLNEGRILGSMSCRLCLPPLCILGCLPCVQMSFKPWVRERESLFHAVFHLDRETQFNITKFYPKSRLCHFRFHSNNHRTIFLIKRDKDQKSLLNHLITVIPLIKKAQGHLQYKNTVFLEYMKRDLRHRTPRIPYFYSQFQGRKDKGRKSFQDCIWKPISHTAGGKQAWGSFSSF